MTIAGKIIETYERNLFSLPLGLQSHFSKRMWRITGDRRYLVPVLAFFQEETLKTAPLFRQVSLSGEIGMRMISSKTGRGPRVINRNRMYKKIPEIYFLRDLVEYLVQFKSQGFGEAYGQFYSQAQGKLRGIDFSQYLLNPDFIKYDPSWAANTMFYLKYLEVVDLEAEFLPLFIDFWQKQNVAKDWLFKSKVYGFTHLIIANSNYYQHFVEGQKYQPVLAFFENSIEEIIRRTTPDVVAEVGLSFRLTGTKSAAAEKIREHLESCFDEKLGYIPKKKPGLSLAEHRNIVAVLFLSQYDKLLAGPNLVDYINKNKKYFYLPGNETKK